MGADNNHALMLAAVAAAAVAWWVMKKGCCTACGQRQTIPALESGMVPTASAPGDDAWGWTYYQNGIVIGADGAYYFNGKKVWSPV